MITGGQRATIALLSDPATHGQSVPVEVIETHISRIFLASDRAWKIKRAVKLPYVDFSTPELRLSACQKEVELNSRTAPGLYLAAHRITCEPGGRTGLDGDGELIDGVVEMRRFDQDLLLDRMAAAGSLSSELMSETARAIIRFHRDAPVVSCEAGSANMAAVLGINEAGFRESRIFSHAELSRFHASMRSALSRHAKLLDRRSAAGRIRRCHGDLHLRNICLLDGKPQLFDCIEFNDQIATVDVLYDLAFLLMDLWHRDLPVLANLVMNRYLDEAEDEDGFPLLPFFMAVRAAVRAHVLATQLEEGASDRSLAGEARTYFELAFALLGNPPPHLVVLGGLSGSGKTTVAEALAAHVGAPPGARIVESDRIRKAMHGVAVETRLPQKAYRPEVSDQVYRELAWRAGTILAERGSVVADAVFDRARHRALIEKVASDNGVPFSGFWLAADPDVLWQRIAARQHGPSDATVDVLALQLKRQPKNVAWTSLDTSRSPDRIAGDVLRSMNALNQAGSVRRSV